MISIPIPILDHSESSRHLQYKSYKINSVRLLVILDLELLAHSSWSPWIDFYSSANIPTCLVAQTTKLPKSKTLKTWITRTYWKILFGYSLVGSQNTLQLRVLGFPWASLFSWVYVSSNLFVLTSAFKIDSLRSWKASILRVRSRKSW